MIFPKIQTRALMMAPEQIKNTAAKIRRVKIGIMRYGGKFATHNAAGHQPGANVK
jgi:hypothetical protein